MVFTNKKEKPSEQAYQLVARLWTLPETEHCQMQEEVALAMALLVDKYREAIIWLIPRHYPDER